MAEVMNVSNVCLLADIVRAAHGCKKVARLVDGNPSVGHARSIGTESGAFGTGRDDVRTQFLRVTLDSGFEAFWPVSELLTEYRDGDFAIY